MTRICLCGKVLDSDKCGFHNPGYENILVLICPYCRRTTFLEMPWMRGIKILETMAKANDEAMAAITRFRNLFDFNDDALKD